MEEIKFFPITLDDLAIAGMRCQNKTPLTFEEIERLKMEICAIQADISIFDFNFSLYTMYCYEEDRILVARDIFPNMEFMPLHPRDALSSKAMLALEYYGYRKWAGKNDWRNRLYAKADTVFNAPGLSDVERITLLNYATFEAEEHSQIVGITEAIRNIIFGKHIWGKFIDVKEQFKFSPNQGDSEEDR